MKLLVSGTSGFVGKHLVTFLERGGHTVLRLTRKTDQPLQENDIFWDPYSKVLSTQRLERLDGVINLAGESLIGIWTSKKKQAILESRQKTTFFLSEVLSQLRKPPKTFISASAVGYYGNQKNNVITEVTAAGESFLARACQEWEKAAQPAVDKGIRVINLRIGVILDAKGGMLSKLIPFFKLGLGAKIGEGNNYLSWIALEDLLAIFYYLLRNASLEGAVNAVSPYPVTSLELTQTLGAVLNRPMLLTIPSSLIQWILGEFGQEMILNSARVRPETLLKAGFLFKYPLLEQCLVATLS